LWTKATSVNTSHISLAHMKLKFRQGIVSYPQSGTFQSFLIANAGYVSLSVGDNVVMATFAHRSSDYLLTESADVPNAWGPIPSSTDCYLYWDIDTRTSQRTFGFTLIEPVFGDEEPPYVADQHWFDTTTNTMKVAVNGTWRETIRVFAAIVNNTVFIPLGYGFPQRPYAGSQVELNDVDAFAGRIILDNTGLPIRKRDGEFFTTEDNIFVDKSPVMPIRLDATIATGTALENMALHQVVKFSDFGQLHLANYDDLQDNVIAMLMQDLTYGETGTVSLQGIIEDETWNWQHVGAPLWVSANGLLTETDPHVANALVFPEGKAPVARVLTRTSIYFEQGLGGKGDQGATGASGEFSLEFLNRGTPLGGPVKYVDFAGPSISASRNGDTVSVNVPFISPPVTYFNHGIALGLADVQQLDYTGQVNVSRSGNRVTVNVPSTPIQWQEDGSNLGTPDANTINFTGQVDLVRVGNTITVNIPTTPVQWQDEGHNLGASNIDTVNVVGDGISATRVGNTILLASVPLDHNNLLNLQGGLIAERYHLSQAQYTNVGTLLGDYATAQADGGGFASRGYVDRSPWKYPVRVATTAAISLTGLQTIDNVLLQAGNLVLVKNQGGSAAHAGNGVYVASATAWQRAPVALSNGSVFYVQEGNVNATQAFVLSSLGSITVGTTPILFTSFNNSQLIVLSGDAAGSGTTSIPVTLTNSGVAPGTYTQVQVDIKGRAIAGSNPTTLVGYGITDAVPKAGGIMTGYLQLNGDPVQPLQAATKQYVDGRTSGAGFTVNGGLALVGTVLSVATANTGRIVVNSNNIDLATTAVTPGTYNQLTVDAYGRVTAGANVGGGTITITGDVSGSGTNSIILTLPNIATAGTYRSVNVNAKGQVTGGTNPTTLSGYGITDAVPRTGAVTLTGGLAFGTSDTVSASNNALTRVKDPVNPQDVATKAYVDTATGTVSYTAGNGINIASGVISTKTSARFAYATGTLDLATTGVTAGTYTSVNVDVYGRVVTASNPTPVNQPITLTGDATGSGTSSITVTLSPSGVTAGTNYNKFNVNAKGIVTSASAQTTLAGIGITARTSDLADVTLTTLSPSQVLSWNGTAWTNAAPIVGADQYVAVRNTDTSPGFLNDKLQLSSNFTSSIVNPGGNEKFRIELSTQGPGVGGPFNTVYTDAYGRITSATNTSGTNQNIIVSGDATGSGTTAITLTLATVATAGTYRSVTVNEKGLVTAGTNPTTIAGYGLTDAQPLNTYLTQISSSSATGFISRWSSGTTAYTRVMTGSAGRLVITNGDGVSGNPTFDLASGVISSPGIFTKVTVDTYGRVIAGGTVTATDVGGLGTIAPQNSNAVTITGGSISGTSVAPRINNVTYAASLTLNWANADVIRITLTGNVVITNSGGIAGQKYLLEIKQGGSGGYTVAFTGETVFGTDLTGITLSTGVGLTDEIGFIYNEVGTSYRCVALTRGFSS